MSSVVGEDKLQAAEEGILPADPLAQPIPPGSAGPASGSTPGAATPGATTPATNPPSGSSTGTSGTASPGDSGKEWLDASKQSARRGEIAVRIVSATVERPRGARGVAPEPCLVLALELSNANTEKIRDYISWSSRAPVAAGTSLADNLGNEYKMKYFAAPLDGQVGKGSIYPSEKLRDVLVFQRPIQSDKLQYLRLRLPAATFGERGVIQFQIPAAWIAQGEENPFTDTPDGPRRPQPRRPTAAPTAEQPPPATEEPDEPKPKKPASEDNIFEAYPDLFPQLKKEGGDAAPEPPGTGGTAPAEPAAGSRDPLDQQPPEPRRPAALDNAPLERAPIDGVGEPPTGDAL